MTGGAELQQNETLAGDLSEELRTRARRTVASTATDAAEARDLLEMLGLVDAPPADSRVRCGTTQGRNRHQHLGEQACPACAEAWNAYRAAAREAGAP